MKSILVFLSVAIWSISAASAGQPPSTVNDSGTTMVQRSANLRLGYHAIYHGMRAGLELPLSSLTINRNKRNGSVKQRTKYRFATANVGWYHHATFHTNVLVTAGVGRRRVRPKGYFTDASLELGYSRTFIGGTTYSVSETGEVTTKSNAGYHYAAISTGSSAGYDFSVTQNLPISAYSRLNLLLLLPYNGTIYPRIGLELGIIYRPANLFSRNINSITRTR